MSTKLDVEFVGADPQSCQCPLVFIIFDIQEVWFDPVVIFINR